METVNSTAPSAPRAPDGEHTLERGDVVCFPAGPAGAHQLMNRSESPGRTLMFSTSRAPAVSVYPDSDKIGVWPGDGENDLPHPGGSAVPWSDGEASSDSTEIGLRELVLEVTARQRAAEGMLG